MNILIFIVTIVLGSIGDYRRKESELIGESEILNVANMAVRSKKDFLQVNGVEVKIISDDRSIKVYEGNNKVLEIESKN